MESRRDRPRGLALVEEARRLGVEHGYEDLVTEIDGWRKQAKR